MKSVFLSALFLFSTTAFAAVVTTTTTTTTKTEVANEEIQNELDIMDEDIVLDKSDEEFLNANKDVSIEKQVRDGITWGKVLEPKKTAKAAAPEKTIKK
jgi:hypothetical protein